MDQSELPDHVRRNRASWDARAHHHIAPAERSWAGEPVWGLWAIPETELRLLPDVAGKDTIELGCGTAYVSAWLARRGARPVGIDNSEAQLATARRLQEEYDLDFPLLFGNAETVPLPDASFDLAISEHGASTWCDPYAWIPEASRLLRPGGHLVFLMNSALLQLCVPDEVRPATDRLLHPQFRATHRFERSSDDAVEFHLSHGEWIRLLRANRFEVLDLVEIRAPLGATTGWGYVTADWANRWPSEEAWIARKSEPRL